MLHQQSIKAPLPEEEKSAPADTGNASNPSPDDDRPAAEESAQFLNSKAEKYIREAGSIEDLPDANDQQQMDDTLQDEKEH